MTEAIVMSLIIGWFLGFVSYWACRVGYKTLMQELEEQALEGEKKPLKDGHPTVEIEI